MAGTLRFRQVSAGYAFTCAVISDSHAYCWGWDGYGQLGDGTTADRVSSVAVLGGRTFRQVRTGENHTWGLGTSDRAWCWGANHAGPLGESTDAGRRQRPVLVAARREFQPGKRRDLSHLRQDT